MRKAKRTFKKAVCCVLSAVMVVTVLSAGELSGLCANVMAAEYTVDPNGNGDYAIDLLDSCGK